MQRSTGRIHTTHVGSLSVLEKFRPEVEEFPEYYEQYFKRAMTGGMAVPAQSLVCTGPVSYRRSHSRHQAPSVSRSMPPPAPRHSISQAPQPATR